MKKKGTNRILPALLFVLILAFLGIFILKEPTLTGFIIYAEEISALNWTFDDVNDFSYDNSLVGISGGAAKMISTTSYTYWNTSAETDYSVISALYDPSDKTDKVNSMDDKKHKANGEKIFDIFFAEELDNNDIVSLYLEGNNEAEIHLCEKGAICGSSNYGLINFNGSGNWYNITINNLESTTNIISIVSSGEVKFNYITSTKGDITKALYNPNDKTSQVQDIDDKKIQINKNNLFNVIFDNNINNGDIISLYLKNNDEAADIYICDYGEFCSSGYGSVDFDGNEGWYNITITNLDEPKDSFNINPSENIKLDYIKAVHIDITEHSSTSISYPASASIETEDISIAGLSSFLNFHKNEQLNGQNISYYYSVDLGSSWNAIPQNNNLSEISVSSGKIRLKVDIAANGSETPIVHDFAVSYLTQICNEDWNATYDACLSNDTKLKYYTDKNECGTTNSLPADNNSYESCDYCKPSWECISYGDCLLTNEKVCKEVKDNNNCFNATGMDSDKYALSYNEFNQSCIYDKTGSNYQNLSISVIANEKTVINATNSTDTVLEVVLNENANNKLISITKHNENLKNTSPEAVALGKYLDIIADDNILNNITSVKIRIYYSDEEINNANLNEETLKIHYFNDTSNQWQVLNSTVNATGNYVEVTIEHLSTFGIFGEEKESASESSSGSGGGGSGGGGGGGKARIIKKAESADKVSVETKIGETEEEIKKSAEIKPQETEKSTCDYKISVSMPEHVSFVEHDYIKGLIYNLGSCKIENLDIGISPELKGIIGIENGEIGGIGFNESAEFSLIKKFEANKASGLLIQGFNIKAPKQNVKTYSGVLTFGAIANEQLAFEEKLNIKVELLESASIISAIGSKAAIFLAVLALFAVALFMFYSKFLQKKEEKLTREQIDEIEERIQEAERRYPNREK